MEPGEQRHSLRMIKSFVDLQDDAGRKIDFKGCVRIAFNRMIRGEFFSMIIGMHENTYEMRISILLCSVDR